MRRITAVTLILLAGCKGGSGWMGSKPKNLLSYSQYHSLEQGMRAKGAPPKKGERLSPKVFCHKMYRILVRDTGRRHSNGRPMADCLQYSVVDSIIETQTGLSMS